jgi:hypothetical protein
LLLPLIGGGSGGSIGSIQSIAAAAPPTIAPKIEQGIAPLPVDIGLPPELIGGAVRDTGGFSGSTANAGVASAAIINAVDTENISFINISQK